MNLKHLDLDQINSPALTDAIAALLFEEKKTPRQSPLSKHPVEVVAGYISAMALYESFERLGWCSELVRLSPFGKVMEQQVNNPQHWASTNDQHKCITYLLAAKEPREADKRCQAFYALLRALRDAGRVFPLFEAIAAQLTAHNRAEDKYPAMPSGQRDSLELV